MNVPAQNCLLLPNDPELSNVTSSSTVYSSRVGQAAPQQTPSVAAPSSTSRQWTPVTTASSQPDDLNPIRWVPCTSRLVLADHLRRGHPYCISYAIASWPESVLPQAHWEYFNSIPATTPSLATVLLRLPRQFRLEVRPTSQFLTVADILRSLYNVRARFPNAILIGLSYRGLNQVNVHFDS